jgi:hypothetical protein
VELLSVVYVIVGMENAELKKYTRKGKGFQQPVDK